MTYRRIVAAALWFVFGWMVAAMVTFAAGLPDGITPVVAAVCAAFIWVDPVHVIWSPNPAPRQAAPVLDPAVR